MKIQIIVGKVYLLEVIRQNIAGWCQQTFCFQKFVDCAQQTFPPIIWIFTEGDGINSGYLLKYFLLYYQDTANVMPARKRIALVAHDNFKVKMVEWCNRWKEVLAKHQLMGTGKTFNENKSEWTTNAIFSIYLGIFRDYRLENIFLAIKLFCFSRQKAKTFSICLK